MFVSKPNDYTRTKYSRQDYACLASEKVYFDSRRASMVNQTKKPFQNNGISPSLSTVSQHLVGCNSLLCLSQHILRDQLQSQIYQRWHDQQIIQLAQYWNGIRDQVEWQQQITDRCTNQQSRQPGCPLVFDDNLIDLNFLLDPPGESCNFLLHLVQPVNCCVRLGPDKVLPNQQLLHSMTRSSPASAGAPAHRSVPAPGGVSRCPRCRQPAQVHP